MQHDGDTPHGDAMPERRVKRSDEPVSAITHQLLAVARRHDMLPVVLADWTGRVIANSHGAAGLRQSRQLADRARLPLPRRGSPTLIRQSAVIVQEVRDPRLRLYVIANDRSGARWRGVRALAEAATGVRRILAHLGETPFTERRALAGA